MGVPFWDDPSSPGYTQVTVDPGDLSLWDVGYIANVRIPGITRVEGSVTRKIDVKNAPGADGATMTHQGYEPAQLTITVTMWRPDQWNTWQALLPTIQPRYGKPPSKPLDFVHPTTHTYGIKAIYVQEISLPKAGTVIGTKEVTIKALQWLPAKKRAVQTPVGAVDTIATTQANTGSGFTGGSNAPPTPPSGSPTYSNPNT